MMVLHIAMQVSDETQSVHWWVEGIAEGEYRRWRGSALWQTDKQLEGWLKAATYLYEHARVEVEDLT